MKMTMWLCIIIGSMSQYAEGMDIAKSDAANSNTSTSCTKQDTAIKSHGDGTADNSSGALTPVRSPQGDAVEAHKDDSCEQPDKERSSSSSADPKPLTFNEALWSENVQALKEIVGTAAGYDEAKHALGWALYGNVAQVRLLASLLRGHADYTGTTYLEAAVERCKAPKRHVQTMGKMVRIFLEQGVPITPRMVEFVSQKSARVKRMLLEMFADASNAQNVITAGGLSLTLLDIAIGIGTEAHLFDLVSTLKEKGIAVSAIGLGKAIARGNENLVHLVLTRELANARYGDILARLIERKNFWQLSGKESELLIKEQEHGETIVEWMIYSNNWKYTIFTLLRRYGIKVTSQALCLAINRKDTYILRTLLDEVADPEQRRGLVTSEVLKRSIQAGDKANIKVLVSPENAHHLVDEDLTLLEYAVERFRYPNLTSIAGLIECGVQVTERAVNHLFSRIEAAESLQSALRDAASSKQWVLDTVLIGRYGTERYVRQPLALLMHAQLDSAFLTPNILYHWKQDYSALGDLVFYETRESRAALYEQFRVPVQRGIVSSIRIVGADSTVRYADEINKEHLRKILLAAFLLSEQDIIFECKRFIEACYSLTELQCGSRIDGSDRLLRLPKPLIAQIVGQDLAIARSMFALALHERRELTVLPEDSLLLRTVAAMPLFHNNASLQEQVRIMLSQCYSALIASEHFYERAAQWLTIYLQTESGRKMCIHMQRYSHVVPEQDIPDSFDQQFLRRRLGCLLHGDTFLQRIKTVLDEEKMKDEQKVRTIAELLHPFLITQYLPWCLELPTLSHGSKEHSRNHNEVCDAVIAEGGRLIDEVVLRLTASTTLTHKDLGALAHCSKEDLRAFAHAMGDSLIINGSEELPDSLCTQLKASERSTKS